MVTRGFQRTCTRSRKPLRDTSVRACVRTFVLVSPGGIDTRAVRFECWIETSVTRLTESHPPRGRKEKEREREGWKENKEVMRSYRPPRVSFYANKLLHATGERDIERLELADRNAAPSLVTRSFIAIERTSRNTPPFLRRGDKSHREDRTRKGTARRGNEAQHEGDRRPRGDARVRRRRARKQERARESWATINLLATLR